MDDSQLLRYSRHILLPEIDVDGQQKLLDAHVVIIGAGGLGSPAALYLASAGVGRITLVDHDTVDLTNLQRQILHGQSSLGLAKALSGQTALARINPEVTVVPVTERLAGQQLEALVADVDAVLDCCDNFDTRHAVNRACVAYRVPLISGAAIRFSGQVAVFDARRADSPCYHCLFPEGEDAEEMRCAVTGVFAPLTGIIGATQAAEALKLISGAGQSLAGRLLLLDALNMEWRSVRYGKDPHCAVCAG